METLITVLLAVSAAYVLFIGVMITTHDFLAMVVYKIIPFSLFVGGIVAVLYRLGYLIKIS